MNTKEQIQEKLENINDFISKLNGNLMQFFDPETGELEHEMKFDETQIDEVYSSKSRLEAELARFD